VALLTTEFKAQAEYQAEKLGLTQIPRTFVAHPISDQTQHQLEEKAKAVADDVLKALTDASFMSGRVMDAFDVPKAAVCEGDV